MAADSECSMCGRLRDPAQRCPHCGNTPAVLGDEVARLTKAIADMNAEDVRLSGERKKLSGKLQAAIYQRDILMHEEAERQKKGAPKQRRWIPRPPGVKAPTAATEPGPAAAEPATVPFGAGQAAQAGDPGAPTVPRQPVGAAGQGPGGPPTRPRVAPLSQPSGPPPEASPREVQNVMLVLGSLLLAIAAVVFAVVALSNVAPQLRLGVLALATLALLGVAPQLVRARLTSTAESLAAVGLALLPIDGYLLVQVVNRGEAGPLVAGLVFAVTAAVALGYHRLTRLTTPRYVVVLAAQPVLPLLAYGMVKGPAGWAVVLTGVAAQNAVLARAVELSKVPERNPIGWSAYWLRELIWVLHGLAVGGALVYGVAALLTANTVPSVLLAGLALLAAAATGLLGALMLRRQPLSEVAAAAMVLAVIGSAARVAVVTLPGRALVVIAAVVALTGLAVRAVPAAIRRGPQLAATVALGVLALFTVGAALRAALALPVAARPVWHADTAAFTAEVVRRAGSPGWSLAATAALLAIAAALALPPAYRREAAVAAAALAALSAPASFGLSWAAGQWLLVAAAVAVLAVGIGAGAVVLIRTTTGPDTPDAEPWGASTQRSARAYVLATVTLAAAALSVALAEQAATAAVLAALTVAGVLLAMGPRVVVAPPEAAVLGDTAAGIAAFSAPGAIGVGVLTLFPLAGQAAALACAQLACAATLGLVAARLVSQRRIGPPLAVGAGLGTLLVAGAAFVATGASTLDAAVGALLLFAAILLALAPSIDSGRRVDRLLDGADIASGAVTIALIAALGRIAYQVVPQAWLVVAAAIVLVVAMAVRSLPEELRRGPAAGTGVAGAVLIVVAGYPALAGGVRALARPGELWSAQLAPADTTVGFGWQGPVALLVLAAAAAVVLPAPRNYHVAAVAVVLATVGTPAALGWPWWAPIVLGLTIATGYAIAAVIAQDARAGYTRLAVAVAVSLHALGASLVRPWTTTAALAMVALVSAALVLMSVLVTRQATADGTQPPGHVEVMGGTGTAGVLLAAPAALAALAATAGNASDIILTAALGGVSIALAAFAAARRHVAPYLGWCTVGVAVSSTMVALLALPTGHPAGVYAAAAVLLVVLAELLRTTTRAQLGLAPAPPRQWRRRGEFTGPQRWRISFDGSAQLIERTRNWPSYPGAMAVAASVAPAVIALVSLAPALQAALIRPYESLGAIWQGPPPPAPSSVDVAAALTALLLTVAAAIAAVGFGGGPTRAVSVVVPGAAITLLITPVSLDLAWPAGVLAALAVFTVCMLSVALTDPPSSDDSDRAVRAARVAVLLIGLVAGGAGLAGALATAGLTIFTFGGAIAVGAAAALGGQSQPARILGWLGGAVAAELFVLTVSLEIGARPEWSAFGVLAVGAVLIVGTALHPRFQRPEALREASAVEWAGYAAGAIGLALASRSTTHAAALLVGWGAVLGIAATRAQRPQLERRILFWAAAASEIAAWWLIMRTAAVALPEAYTLPFALLALVVGLLELRQRPRLGSWAAYGPALIAAFGPTVIVVLVTDTNPIREVGLLVAGILTLILGSQRRQQAPVAIGAAVTVITALHALTLVGYTWLGVLIGGIVLIILGANNERRRQATDRYNQMR
ncbi:SCO7613 C-terminal domain-containing membrane protein [Catellatospora tritici]|uniref:SCO7613 C-terminal domain-containing membrane protein n=1 Tax=Catellatospora tritici TaxID=2851566 RepID=UPI001C2D9E69|nr:permease [Catellatospora tritici]MBV1849582.1 permease [Catellatospora tritici]